MRGDLQRRIELLEGRLREKITSDREMNERMKRVAFEKAFPILPVNLQEVVDTFRAWFDDTFPSYIVSEPEDDRKSLNIPLEGSAYHLAVGEMSEWMTTYFPNFDYTEPIESHRARPIDTTLDRLTHGLHSRIWTEVQTDLVPIEQRRYFIDPLRWAFYVSARDANGNEMMPGYPKNFSFRPISQPKGAELKLAIRLTRLMEKNAHLIPNVVEERDTKVKPIEWFLAAKQKRSGSKGKGRRSSD